MAYIVDVLDPIGKFELMSAASIVFGQGSALFATTANRLGEGSVIEAWPRLLPDERKELVCKWLKVIEYKLSR